MSLERLFSEATQLLEFLMAAQGGVGGSQGVFLFDFKDKHAIRGGEALRKAKNKKKLKKKRSQGNLMKSSFLQQGKVD